MIARELLKLNADNVTNGLVVDDRAHTQGENGFHIRSFLILFDNKGLKL